jgi:hypothetical protein
VSPETLAAVNRQLSVNEDVLRYVVLKRDGVPKLPPARRMFHGDRQFGRLLRPPPRPGALPIPLSPRAAAAAAAAAGRPAAAGGAPAGAPPQQP